MPNLHKTLDGYISQGRKFAPGFYFILIFLFTLLFVKQAVLAQTSESLIVQPPESSQFPEITVSIKLPSSKSDMISELGLRHLNMYENGEQIQPDSLNWERRGIHFTLAINPGPSLDIYDIAGVSAYDKLRDVLVVWAGTRSSLLDDAWSFIGGEEVLIANSRDRGIWSDALNAYQPNFRSLQPQIASLEEAIELSDTRVVPFGVDKAILYITPAPLPDQIQAINELSNRASLNGIQVNVWMIDEAYFLTNDQGKALIDLAENTGGNLFIFTGSEDLPNPEMYLVDLGYYFTLSYQSRIRETGTNSLVIELNSGDDVISGESAPFFVEVSPPNPILVSPPAVINRIQSAGETVEFLPSSQAIEFMVEFPDSHHRPITASRLLVDGEVVEEQRDGPLDALSWDLSSITNSGEHTIQVEVEDSLGLSGRTILTPISIEVLIPEVEQRFDLGQIGLVALGILFVISLFIFIPWMVRRYWQTENFKTILPAKFVQDHEIKQILPKLKDSQHKVAAKLIPIGWYTENSDGIINIIQSQVRIGRDPGKVGVLIDDASVDEIQAMIIHSEEGFWINDLGSTNGSWVNYKKIGRQPVRIHTGDVLYFGMSGFRFVIADDESLQKITISKYEPLI